MAMVNSLLGTLAIATTSSLLGIALTLLPQKYPSLDFLQNPIFLQECSIFMHLLLLLGLIGSCSWRMFQRVPSNHAKERNFGHVLLVLFSLVLFLYNMVLCCLHYFHWYSTYVSHENFVTLWDLALTTLCWLLISIYLHTLFKYSSGLRISWLLTIWWGSYIAFSSYCLVIHIHQCSKHHCPSLQVLMSDVVNFLSGILFLYVGNSIHVIKENDSLQKPLLNEDISIDSSKGIESETLSPYSNAGFFSNLTFSWMGSLISRGYMKALNLDDLPCLSHKHSADECYMIFRNYLESSKDGSDQKVTPLQLAKSLILTTWGDILLGALFFLLNTLASYVGPYLIDTFIQYLNGEKTSKNEGYLLVLAFLVAKLVECLAEMHSTFRVQVVGVRVKATLIESICNKAMNLSCLSKQRHTSGEMINFMSVDAERVGQFSWYIHDPWMIILQVVLALLILYKNLGLASIAAFVATVLVMMVNYPLSSLLDKYQNNLMESKDRRMKATSEILKNMRILKLQAWEMKFLSKILELRKNENGWLKKSLYTSAMTTSIFWVAPIFVSVVTFGTCMIMGIPLASGKILSAIATFRILQVAIYNLPGTVSVIVQTKVSLYRIASFLSLDELEHDSIEKFPRSMSELALEISRGNFGWDPSASSPTLKDINLKVQHGMRIAVCGNVGSGKTTLLSCILGEVPKISGTVKLGGSKAYVPQSPWIHSGKIVDNILFGQEMDAEKYNNILEACSLKKDLEILPFGDQTIIGERGLNLSGGQKQRVQIARALYQNADIYIFDDPFSALDAHTRSHIFKECLLGILGSKTVIYVTHQVEFLPAADVILVMKDGRILQAGKYHEILNSGTDFMELVQAHEQALSALDTPEAKLEEPKEDDDDKILVQEPNDDEIVSTDDSARPNGQLVQEEEREKGRVGFSIYWKYLTTAYGGVLVPLILLSQLLFQLLQILSNYWMAWATPISPDSKATVDGKTLILVYVALAIGSSLCILARSTFLVMAAYKTATLLFTKMHLCIFRASMSFFDATPSGRILNRVSTDQSAVDMNTPIMVSGFAFSLISLLGIIVVMSLVVWQVYLIFIPIIAISIMYQQYYLPSARELFRLIGVTKAPLIQHFSETISGLATIRSFDQESRFDEMNLKLINEFSQPRFYSAAAMQWLCFRLDMLSSFIFACSLIFLIFLPKGLIAPVIAGLAVTYTLNLNMQQSRVITNLSRMENRIISVERILQYTNIPSEAPLVVEANRPDPAWPSCGEVIVQDLEVRYAPQMPLVLRGITCTFQGGKKTGIVGRTGCGKSTLIQALFRIMEPATGRIIIDGIDISSIGLHDLRSRLSIIPQDPIMYEGTIRGNLDPLDEYTDEQIWTALDKCQLGNEVRKKEAKLDSIVSENGENWSMGQRQLISLGRVILKRSKVLVLDEATASVDTTTDNLIQQTLRESFSDSTVIVVAHRITSIIDSDMVVFLSHGVVVECDSPLRLLENQSSLFAKLVAQYTNRSKSRMEKLN